MRITQMTNEQLINELIICSAKEATYVPRGNGIGKKSFMNFTDRRVRLETEILSRMTEVRK